MKITDYPRRTAQMGDEDVFLIDGSAGTQILPAKVLVMSTIEIDAAIAEAELAANQSQD